ncbi:MAG TPA: polyprenyl synthetase family protein [Planctomycetia bacterium]|nr:polyprenyl synthetase family protein [Planctomycetia bacterium]
MEVVRSGPLLRDVARPESHDADLKEQLGSLYAPIQEELTQTERRLRDALRSDSDFIEELVKRVQLYGGKRLRPALLLLSGRACGRVDPDHVALAATVELIHVATLVHDDVLDEANVRRHVTTVNAEWGMEPSLLLGDFLFTHAFQLAAEVSTPDACRWLGRSTNRTCGGELHQISRRGAFELPEAEYLEMLAGKTAELISCACGLGARYAGAPPEWERALASYGRNLGIAFQIADDVLDLCGDEATTGKPTGSDWRKRKLTLPLIRLRETASAATRAQLRDLFDEASPERLPDVLEMIRAGDALDYSRRRALEFVQAAASDISILPECPAKDSLVRLPRFAVERTA